MTPTNRQRGFAMLIVLWTLSVLALVCAHLTSAARGDIFATRVMIDAARAEAAADAAVHAAAYHLLDHPARRWAADGLIRRLSSPGVAMDLQLADPRGLINPNSALPVLMAALIQQFTGDAPAASAIAAAIFDWRTPGPMAANGASKAAQYAAEGRARAPSGRPFVHLDELGDVLGMTPALLAALRPHLSLYNFGTIDPAFADPFVARALAAAQVGQPADEETGPIVLVRAEAVLDTGARFVRRATLLLRPGPGSRPFRVLTWDSGDE